MLSPRIEHPDDAIVKVTVRALDRYRSRGKLKNSLSLAAYAVSPGFSCGDENNLIEALRLVSRK